MQGIFIGGRRPKSKKEVKDTVSTNPEQVRAEATSAFGGEFDGSVSNLPEGKEISFVGPDPYRDRRWYGSITRKNGKLVVK